LASAVYKSDTNTRTLSPPVIALALALVDIQRINDSSGHFLIRAIAPTKPAHTWHFVARAAASPRAPTLAS